MYDSDDDYNNSSNEDINEEDIEEAKKKYEKYFDNIWDIFENLKKYLDEHSIFHILDKCEFSDFYNFIKQEGIFEIKK